MAEEQKDETVETPGGEANAEAAGTTEAAAPEADAPEAEAPEAEAPKAEVAQSEAEAAPVEAEERLSPKEARRRARSKHAGEARPPRSPEERSAERAVVRAAKAESRARGRARTRAKRRERRAGAAAEGPAPAPAREPGRPKVRQGVVVSDRPDKTITVRIDVARRHPRYKKIVRSSTTLHAHDERNDAHAGDTVRVVECRPMSRLKRWRLVEVLERAK